MNRGIRVLFVSLVVALIAAGCQGPPPAPEVPQPRPKEWYFSHYPYMKRLGRVFTFETEFQWPRGYRRPDSADLSTFQFWVSHLPLRARNQAVGSLRKGRVYEPEQVSRPIHLPWRTTYFSDAAIPLQLLAEFYNWQGRQRELTIIPRAGDTLNYEVWLRSKVVYGPRRDVRLQPAEAREPSDSEYDRFFDLCAYNTTYGSLEANCVPVDDADVAPGDILIARNEKGTRGKVLVVVCELIDRRGGKLYVVGTGCDFGCDFHIPLVGDDRARPWVTVEQIRAMAGDWPNVGFFRLRGSLGDER